MRTTTTFDFTGKQSKYRAMKEQIVTIYAEKSVKKGKAYLVDKGNGLALSFHNKKGVEIDYISGVIALKNMSKAKKWFDSLN